MNTFDVISAKTQEGNNKTKGGCGPLTVIARHPKVNDAIINSTNLMNIKG